MHRVDSERGSDRGHERRQNDDRRVDLEHAAEHEQHHVQGQQEHVLRVDVGSHRGEQQIGDLGVHEPAREPQRAREQDEHGTAEYTGLHEHARKLAHGMDVDWPYAAAGRCGGGDQKAGRRTAVQQRADAVRSHSGADGR